MEMAIFIVIFFNLMKKWASPSRMKSFRVKQGQFNKKMCSRLKFRSKKKWRVFVYIDIEIKWLFPLMVHKFIFIHFLRCFHSNFAFFLTLFRFVFGIRHYFSLFFIFFSFISLYLTLLSCFSLFLYFWFTFFSIYSTFSHLSLSEIEIIEIVSH